VEVLGRDAVGRGEGRVGGRGGLVRAAGDPERRVGVGGAGQRLEAVAEEELEEDAVDLHADARHGSRLTRIRASHGRILRWGDGIRIGWGFGDAGGGVVGEGESYGVAADWRGGRPDDDGSSVGCGGGGRRKMAGEASRGHARMEGRIERKDDGWGGGAVVWVRRKEKTRKGGWRGL
jgi:hypothetical protein